MKKITTTTGYIAYEATKEEIQLLGGYGHGGLYLRFEESEVEHDG